MIYVSKVHWCFLLDVDGPMDGLEMECLKPGVGTNVLESAQEHLMDIGKFDVT